MGANNGTDLADKHSVHLGLFLDQGSQLLGIIGAIGMANANLLSRKIDASSHHLIG